MQKISARAFSTNFNPLFYFPILMVNINGAKLQGLLYLNNGNFECLGVKHVVVCMVIHNSDAMGIAYLLKCQLSFDRSFSVHFRHEMSICEIGKVIHKNSGTYVPFGTGSTTMRGNESWCWDD